MTRSPYVPSLNSLAAVLGANASAESGGELVLLSDLIGAAVPTDRSPCNPNSRPFSTGTASGPPIASSKTTAPSGPRIRPKALNSCPNWRANPRSSSTRSGPGNEEPISTPTPCCTTEGRYRLWYGVQRLDDITRSYVCYAESDDGFTWQRPELGLCEYEGSTRNNIICAGRDHPLGWGIHRPQCPSGRALQSRRPGGELLPRRPARPGNGLHALQGPARSPRLGRCVGRGKRPRGLRSGSSSTAQPPPTASTGTTSAHPSSTPAQPS